MGGANTKETMESKSKNSNGKTIELLAEMCSSWGFGNTKNQVVSQLVKALNDSGYDVKSIFEPMSGGNGEFFVYQIENGKKTIVFSNSKKAHESAGAVIGKGIQSSNVQEIIKKIVV